MLAPRHDVHPERLADTGDERTDAPQSEQAQPPPVQPDTDTGLPTSLPHRPVVGDDIARQRMDEAPCQLRRRRDDAGRPAHGHAPRQRRGDVDRRVRHPRRDEQPDGRDAREERVGDPGPFAHRDEDLRVADAHREGALVRDVLVHGVELDVDAAPVGRRPRHVLIVIQHHAAHDVPSVRRPDREGTIEP